MNFITKEIQILRSEEFEEFKEFSMKTLNSWSFESICLLNEFGNKVNSFNKKDEVWEPQALWLSNCKIFVYTIIIIKTHKTIIKLFSTIKFLNKTILFNDW